MTDKTEANRQDDAKIEYTIERYPVMVSKHEAQGFQGEEKGEHGEGDSERAPA